MESATITNRPGAVADDPDAPQYDERRHVSLAGMQEEPQAAPVTRIETLAVFIGFGAFYMLLGIRLLSLHVVNFDALDQLTRAYMVWYNDPPKLAAIGFSMPPVGTLVLLPFAAIKALVASGLALPISSAIFGAGTLTFINRMFAMADMVRPARLLIVVLVGLNPMFAFYAMNGSGDAAYLLFAAFGMFCVLGWGRNGSARYLIGAGLWGALAEPFFRYVPGVTPEAFERVRSLYDRYDFWAIFLAGLTPLPYKVFTISAGVFGVNLGIFVVASILSRGLRFFLVAGLIYRFGPPVKEFIDRHFNTLTWAFGVLLILGFVVIELVL